MRIETLTAGILGRTGSLKKLSIFAVALAAWQLLGMLGFIRTEIIPMPSEVLAALMQLLLSGTLVWDAAASLKRVLVGFAIGAFLGVAAGILLASFKKLAFYVRPLIEVIRPIPPIAWIPIAILWFGIGDSPAFFLVSLGAFFPVFSNTFDGVKNIEENHINAAKSLGAGKKMLFLDILLPASSPSILTGLHVGLGVAWMIVITAEIVGATSGLGYMIQLNRIMLQTQFVIVGMVAIGLLGVLMLKAMELSENFLIPWKKTNSLCEL